jgi:hypothetical protein
LHDYIRPIEVSIGVFPAVALLLLRLPMAASTAIQYVGQRDGCFDGHLERRTSLLRCCARTLGGLHELASHTYTAPVAPPAQSGSSGSPDVALS